MRDGHYCILLQYVITRHLTICWTRYNDNDSDVEDTEADQSTTTRLLRVHLPNEQVTVFWNSLTYYAAMFISGRSTPAHTANAADLSRVTDKQTDWQTNTA